MSGNTPLGRTSRNSLPNTLGSPQGRLKTPARRSAARSSLSLSSSRNSLPQPLGSLTPTRRTSSGVPVRKNSLSGLRPVATAKGTAVPGPLTSTDRHIPLLTERSTAESDYFRDAPALDPNEVHTHPADALYRQQQEEALGYNREARVLSYFQTPKGARKHTSTEDLRSRYGSLSASKARSLHPLLKRHIPTHPEVSLDAPGLTDDYYLNLIDWSRDNILAVALDEATYLWNPVDSRTDLLMTEPSSFPITALRHGPSDHILAIGTDAGTVQIWDTLHKKHLRTLKDQGSRITSLAWRHKILSVGTALGKIHHHDVGIASSLLQTLEGHTSEVCGLAWRPDGSQLASGGNDTLLNIWGPPSSAPSPAPLHRITHHAAAVKALAWCPWQKDLLATGAGKADTKLRFYNTTTGIRTHCVATGSAITALVWNKEYREVLTAHAHAHLSLWSYPTITKVADIPAHDARILNMVPGPTGARVATIAADEALRIWKVWDPKAIPTGKRIHPVVKTPSLH